MEQDFVVELENKVDTLINAFTTLKEEHKSCNSQIDSKNNRIQELEGENDSLRKELISLKDTSNGQRKKLDTAAEKVRALITKLEAVEQ